MFITDSGENSAAFPNDDAVTPLRIFRLSREHVAFCKELQPTIIILSCRQHPEASRLSD